MRPSGRCALHCPEEKIESRLQLEYQMTILDTLYPGLSMMHELTPNIACVAAARSRTMSRLTSGVYDFTSGIPNGKAIDRTTVLSKVCTVRCLREAYQCPEEIRELERVLEQDEVDEDEHEPGAVEPEQLDGRAHDDAPLPLPGGVLRGDLVGQLVYDVLQLCSDQKQRLQTAEMTGGRKK